MRSLRLILASLRCAPGAPRARTVEVVVTDAGGAPISGAQVRVVGAAESTTGRDGVARAELNGAGALLITHPAYLSDAADVAARQPRVTVRLERGGTVRGVVRNERGEPAPGVRVAIGPCAATSGADGRYEVQALPEGHWELSCARADDVSAIACPVQAVDIAPPKSLTVDPVVYELSAQLHFTLVSVETPELSLERDGRYLPHLTVVSDTSLVARVPSGPAAVRVRAPGVAFHEQLNLRPGEKVERTLTGKRC